MAKRAEKEVSDDLGPKLLIKTPAEETLFSQGFYQVEEDSLYVPLYPSGRFFSYLDSPQVSLQTDNSGRLIFIQIHLPRSQWKVRDHLEFPAAPVSADIRLVEFRGNLPPAVIERSPDGTTVRVGFGDPAKALSYQIAESLVCDVTTDARLAAIWIGLIQDDRAAEKMAAWRKELRLAETEDRPDRSNSRREIDR